MVVAVLLLSGTAALAGSAAASSASPATGVGAAPGLTANVLAPVNGGIYYNNTGSVTVTWTVNKQTYQNWGDIKNYTSVLVFGAGTQFKTYTESRYNNSRTFTGVPEGKYWLVIQTVNGTTDPTNNTNVKQFVIIVNKASPVVQITGMSIPNIPSYGYYTNKTDFTVSFFAPSDPKPIVNYSGRLDMDGTNGTTWVTLGNVTSAAITKINNSVNPLLAGSYRVNIRAYDAAGNWSTATPVNFTVGPMVTINVPQNGAYLNAAKQSGWYASWTPSLVGATPVTSYTAELYNVTTHKLLGSIPITTSNLVLINNFTGATPLTNGTTYDFNVTILSGGKTFKAVSMFKVDTKAPIVTITSPLPYPANITNKNHFQIAWTMADANPDYSKIWIGNATRIVGPYQVNGSSGVFTITDVQVPDGSYWLNVTSYDMAMNPGWKNITFHLEAVPPAIVIGVPQYTNNRNVTITWNATDANKVDVVKMWLKDITHNITYPVKVLSTTQAIYRSGQIAAANLTNGVLLADAQWQVYVWANDTYANNDTQFKNFTVDTVNPTVSIESPTAFIKTGNFTAEWEVSDVAYAAPISLYQVRLGYPSGASTTWVNQSTNTTVDIKALNGGAALAENAPGGDPYVFAVRAYDAAGNLGATVLTFIVDVTNPTLNVTTPVKGQGFNSKNVTFAWTANDALSGLDYFLVKVDNGTNKYVSASTFQYTAVNLTEGNHNVTFVAYDKAANQVSVLRNFAVDLVPPVVNITTPVTNSYLKDAAVFVAWNASDNIGIVKVEVSVDGSVVELPGTAVNYTTSALLQNWHWINVTVYDNATSSATSSVRVFVQLLDPIVGILTPADNAYLNTVNVTMGYLAQSMGNPNAGVAYTEVSLDGGNWTNNAANNFYVFTNLTDGAYTLSVRAIDNAGRVSAVASRIVNIDTVKPVVTITFPAEGQKFAVDYVNATWSVVDASPIAKYEVSTNDGASWTDVGTSVFHNFTALPQGNTTVWVMATDAAGNFNMTKVTFLVDTMAPWIQFVQPFDGQALPSKTVFVEWNVTDNTTGIQAVWIWLDGVQQANVTVELNYTFTGLSEGDHVIALQAWDNLMNQKIASVTIKVDTIAPLIVITQPTLDERLSTPDVTLSFSVTDTANGSGVAQNWFAVDSGTYTSLGVNTTVVMSGLGHGAHVALVKSMDNVGNVRIVQRNFTVDLIAPTVTATSPSGRAVVVTTVITASFSEAMNQATVRFAINGATPVAPTSWSGNLATFDPTVDLLFAKNYTVVVSGKDLAGNEVTGSARIFVFATKCLVTGTVKDADGNLIANATVTLKQGSNQIAQVMTNANGAFTMVVPEGSYNLTISADGKQDFSKAVVVAVGASNNLEAISMKNVDNWTWLYIVIIIIVVAIISLFIYMRKKGGAAKTSEAPKPKEQPKK